jgi:hypothetical protein
MERLVIMIDFCHIAPTPHLDLVRDRKTHLLLAHLVEDDPDYVKFYVDLKKNNRGLTYILDNSAFEMYKQGRQMYPSNKLIEMGEKIDADYIVMSDYPGESGQRTISAACFMAPQLREAGFGTFFVPQSEIGNIRDYLETCLWASRIHHVDYIGISILGVPNAYGVEKDNKLQRFVSRWKVLTKLTRMGFFGNVVMNKKKIHMLGMVDGPNEIDLVKHFPIDTWDSSAGVWTGLNGIRFDGSPTGLIDGKFEKEVDFNFHTDDTSLVNTALDNMAYIDRLCSNE